MAASADEKDAVTSMLKDWKTDVTALHTAIQTEVGYVIADDDTDYLSVTASPGSAGNLTLVGTPPDIPRKVTITSPDNNAAKSFTVEGTDRDDAAITDTGITGPNAGTVSSPKFYKTVTRIAIDAAGSNISAGIGEVDAKPLMDAYNNVKAFSSTIPRPTLDNALTSIKADAS